jgi:hypothetical protein
MKNRAETTPSLRRASPRRSIALPVAAMLCLFTWPGCSGSVAEPGTGETHFLGSCDAGCGGDLSCICGVCTKPCSGPATCSAFRAACLPDLTCSGNVCGIECTREEDCRSLGTTYTCENSRCRERPANAVDAGSDFSSCERPPPSSCGLSETCAHLECGGLEFDEHGCRRAPCTTDADCQVGDRCTSLQCVDPTVCTFDQRCSCATIFDCSPGLVCNSTAVVGPRGDWKTLEVRRASGPCPPGATCTSWWRIGSDGILTVSCQPTVSCTPVPSNITVGDLDALRVLVDGPSLRIALRDGIPCDAPPTDIGVTIRLELSTETLERDVTGCVLSGPASNVFQQVDQIVETYPSH